MTDGENYDDVVRQMEHFGIKFRDKDLPLQVGRGKKTVGIGGKHWYRLHTFAPDGSTRRFIVGAFGSYRNQGSAEKVEWDKDGLSAETLARYKREQAEARETERKIKEAEAREAALTAAELWASASREGHSPYLDRKGVEPEACRYLPDGSLLIPLLRYDWPRERALRALQRIYPGPRIHRRTKEPLPQKTFTKGFGKSGCALRLGAPDAPDDLVLVCEGYATGLSIRMALARAWPVYVALDAYNLPFVMPILRELHPDSWLLICADDDWRTKDHEGRNPGQRAARKAAKATERCEHCWPVFEAATRAEKDTDFNDLHARQGLDVVARQIGGVIARLQERIGD